MNKHKLWIVVLALAFAVCARADVSPEKRVEIDKMLQLTGMEKLVQQMKVQMLANLQRGLPGAPSGFWEKINQKMDPHEIIELIVPVYDKYYTIDDLKAVNGFYSSPAGQKILATLPQVMHDSQIVGQEWGKRIAQETTAELAAERKAAADKEAADKAAAAQAVPAPAAAK